MNELQKLQEENERLKEILESLDISIYDDNVVRVLGPARRLAEMREAMMKMAEIIGPFIT